jgi:hypothetical protein
VNQREQVRTFIEAARLAAETPELDQEDREKVAADLDFMERELARPEPRWGRLKAVAGDVRIVLLGGLGEALGAAITALPWHDAINSIPWT